MGRTRLLITALALLAGEAGAQQTAASAGGAPAWMSGCWLQQDGPAWAEECWTTPRAGMMLGSSRTGKGDVLQSWEATQILPDASGKLAFWASPNGKGRYAFPLASRGPQEIVFADPTHDYPQRIRYWREGDTLNAEISLLDGSKPMRWRFNAVR